MIKDLNSLKEVIKNKITLEKLLLSERYIRGGMSEEQLSCPFHGKDVKKSARYYKDTDTMYCWVCKQSWDIFSFIERKEGVSFKEAIATLVKRYGIDISKVPNAIDKTLERKSNEVFVGSKSTKVNDRLLKLEKLSQSIKLLKSSAGLETYSKLIYSYMVLKYTVSEEKFNENYELVKKGTLRVIENIKKR